jgi:hypothetical protein
VSVGITAEVEVLICFKARKYLILKQVGTLLIGVPDP